MQLYGFSLVIKVFKSILMEGFGSLNWEYWLKIVISFTADFTHLRVMKKPLVILWSIGIWEMTIQAKKTIGLLKSGLKLSFLTLFDAPRQILTSKMRTTNENSTIKNEIF